MLGARTRSWRVLYAWRRLQTLFWLLLRAIWGIFHRTRILSHWNGTIGISWMPPTIYLWVLGSDIQPETHAASGFLLCLGSKDWHPWPRGWAPFHGAGPLGWSLARQGLPEMSCVHMMSEGWRMGNGVGCNLCYHCPPSFLLRNCKSLPRLLIKESLNFWRNSTFHKTQIISGNDRVVKRPQAL